MKQFLTGLLCGAVIALLIAAVGAIYVTDSPVPFMSKIQSSSTDFVQEATKGRSPDPNDKLYAPGTTPKTSAPAASSEKTAPVPAPAPAVQPQDAAAAVPAPAPAAQTANTVQPQSPDFFVQVGAYKNPDETETIRAKIAFAGLDSRAIHGNDGFYRVRLGPYRTQAEAEKVLKTLKSNDLPGQVIH